MSELRDRNILYARLEEVLGKKPAAILMQQLPQTSELATRDDLTRLEGALSGRIDGLAGRMGHVEGRLERVEGRLERVEDRIDKLDGRMERVEMRMDRLGDRMERLEGRFHGFHEALRDQTRQYILMLAGAMVTLTAAVFGLARVA